MCNVILLKFYWWCCKFHAIFRGYTVWKSVLSKISTIWSARFYYLIYVMHAKMKRHTFILLIESVIHEFWCLNLAYREPVFACLYNVWGLICITDLLAAFRAVLWSTANAYLSLLYRFQNELQFWWSNRCSGNFILTQKFFIKEQDKEIFKFSKFRTAFFGKIPSCFQRNYFNFFLAPNCFIRISHINYANLIIFLSSALMNCG